MSQRRRKTWTWILVSVLALVITAGYAAYRMYNKPHRDVQHIKPIPVAAMKLVSDYEANEARANNEYLDKVLEVSGQLIETTKNQQGETILVLDGTGMGTVRCTLEASVQHDLKTKSPVTIRGICTGYLTDVILVRCIIPDK